MYLLDTNIVSETRKSRPHGAVTAWLRDADDRHLHVSAVTLGEIQAGVELTREQDAEKALEIEAFIERIVATMTVLPMTPQAFRIWAKLMHRKSDALTLDAMIAATAQAHELTVVTRNVKDFRSLGVPIVNPYSLG